MTEKHIDKNADIKLTAYERVVLARSTNRPNINDYIDNIFDDFIELKGDRLRMDDPSVIAGIAMLEKIPVTIIGHRKGKNTSDNIKCNFGMASPEGYRKAIRLMKQAEKFGRPVITFVDTPGAYPGLDAEANGQSNAIANCICVMGSVRVPTITIITGEGNSGGALALAVADKVYMLSNSVYSILSPEGFASILWKDSKRCEQAAEMMKITAEDLLEYGLIDGIISDNKKIFSNIKKTITADISELEKCEKNALINKRYKKFRNIDGIYRPQRSLV